MDDPPETSFGARLSRRAVLSSTMGFVALSLPAGRARAQSDDHPPVFQTARHQFTIVRPSRTLPAVSLSDLGGSPRKLAPVAGKVLLINFWATWCDACRTDLPLLERFQRVAGSLVEVAAVSTDRVDRQQVKAFLHKLAIRTLPIFLDPDGRLASESADGTAPLPIYGMPVTYLITPSGRVAGYMPGVADWLAEDAQQLLAYYAAT